MSEEFKPKIIVFCCNWCSYAGADLAGISRFQITPHFRVIRTYCSARVDPEFILHAYKRGADGVLVLGCHPENCKYLTGSSRSKARIQRLQAMLEKAGADSSKVAFGGIASVEPLRFIEYVTANVQGKKVEKAVKA